jgi:uncharacterized membrane protein YkvA (DUF1232 family)
MAHTIPLAGETPAARTAVKRAVAIHQPRRAARTVRELRNLLWPIVKRLPAYIRLGWALGKEPAVSRRHKALLLSAALYSLTPAQLVTGVIPVIGQIDSVVLFLLGLRHALRNCPAEVADVHLDRLGLERNQLESDLQALLDIAVSALHSTSGYVGENLRFAGRVASGLGRRTLKRISGTPDGSVATPPARRGGTRQVMAITDSGNRPRRA